jgi:hypothetical protein
LDDLSIKDSSNSTVPTIGEKVKTTAESVAEEVVVGAELSPAEMRSKADALYKEAAKLRKEADEIDPPKSKKATKEAV